MYTIFRENFFYNIEDKLHHPRSVACSAEQVLLNKQQVAELVCNVTIFYNRGCYTWIFTTVNVRFTVPTPRSETTTVTTNPNPNPILNVATVKTFTFKTALTNRYAVKYSKLIAVKLHGK